VVVANGEFERPASLLRLVDGADIVIAADGGANWLLQHERLPDVLIGDMDSVRPEVLGALARGDCRLVRHRPDKDETDTELAVAEALARGAGRITIIGALGGRVDHALANVLLLTLPQLAVVEATIYDGVSFIHLIRDELVLHGRVGDTLSLLPVGGDVEGIVTAGLEYPLRGETLHLGPARGVSNVLTADRARITIGRGLLLAIHTPGGAPEATA
jgi:thiamine pyrophosphokinase